MKLSTVLAQLTFGKETFTVLGGLALAGAALTLAAPSAQAQEFGIGVQFGGPRYVAPAPAYRVYAPAYAAPGYGYAPGYWQERRAEDWREHEWREHEAREHAFREHEEWEHRGYDYDRGYGR